MVAETPIYSLPYQEGSDQPCFGPGTGCDNLTSVWCDFVALVEAQLDIFDGFVGRTATAIPMAKLTVEGTWTSGVCGTVPFDTVIFDTDGMVDLNAGAGITPNRNGVYRIDHLMIFDSVTTVTNLELASHIMVGTEAEPSTIGTFDGSVATAFTLVQGSSGGGELRASTLYRFTDTLPNPRMVTASFSCDIGFVPVDMTYRAALEMYWHGEE